MLSFFAEAFILLEPNPFRCEKWGATKPPPMLRITQLVRQATLPPHGISLNLLLKKINAAAAEARVPGKINYRLLKRVRDADPSLGITSRAMEIFACYFPELKLQPAFVTPGLMDGLVGSHRLTFLLGAKPDRVERRNDISHWDNLALAELLAQCLKATRHHNFSIKHAMWRGDITAEAFPQEPWFEELLRADTSVISIGSPVISLSSEWMLAEMFGRQPGDQPDLAAVRRMPFGFAWRPEVVKNFRSAFHVSLPVLQKLDAGFAREVGQNQSAAFWLEGALHKVPMPRDRWIMHGVIAAQRQPKGNVWLVVSGLSGPATLAAASKVRHIMDELPWSNGQRSPALWMPVKAIVKKGIGSSADIREVESVEFDGVARLWKPENSRRPRG